ncbi:MAG: KTSC protein [Lokiarchaeia virus VerdaV4]|uniref:KTSC protein n=1 Tax=Lokiarchaeia virus VerdaV4 TaxID=3070172 RepID=A0AA35G7C8_9CAUD|nr:MAG: KTSC protein [Lokiarchaeia virus VerdaV4]BDI54962.1 MAG: KTSC protein [Lokiarchaeia virus VerdaV4]
MTWKTLEREEGKFIARAKKTADYYGPWINTPESSNVLRFCYAMAKLIVDFKNGSEYAYFVPPSYYIAMNNAPSKGRFVHNELRKANKPYRLLRGPFKKPIGEVRREVPYRTEPGRPRRKYGEEVLRGPFKEKKPKWEGGEEW